MALQNWVDTSAEFNLIDDPLEIDKETSFELKPILQGGFGYASYEDYFDRKREWWNDPNFDNVVEHQWWLYQASTAQISQGNFQVIAKLLQLLADKNRFYTTNHIVVFFGNKPSELALKAQDCHSFVQLVRNLSEPQVQAINKICGFLGGNNEDEHFYAKKNAFSTTLTDYLTEKEGRIQHDICDLVADIVNITNQALTQYDLYLEDFSYSKFVKKIEENASKFTTRINDALGKSVTQVLGIPVATAVFNLVKIDLHWGSVLSLMIYTLLCALVLWTQQNNLFHIEKEFEIFEKTLPKQLKNNTWNIHKNAIFDQLKNQKRLIKFLWLIIVCAFCYSSGLICYLSAITDFKWVYKLLNLVHSRLKI
ncbi:hypothetical protein ACFBZI_10465 [Moraxella sp. ZJ142]|uniref:hypothetical protein n=1 Tax=Moraxella marmotae TaxID=3344520 RepID=UPI0035D4A411